MIRVFSVVSVAAALAATAAAAQTTHVPEVSVGSRATGQAIRISTAKVNFDNPASAGAFFAKVHLAANDVCAPLSALSPSAKADCVVRTQNDVAQGLNRPQLSASGYATR